ncbi:hypothetical protein [Catellatospora tritici]|uniref:hypothetical protein n=1 Tax=Catellatospora tritici TaxID=2851566 RepID=UPI001C2DABDE|nr:hypothetical protein [Catellatospora tritici]MBV1851841.1 hypothetical protein [Catellatospora tritici]
MTRRRTIVATLVVTTVLASGLAFKVWRDTPPYGPEVLHATAALRPIEWDEATAEIYNAPHPRGGQLIHGQVTWESPPVDAGGQFEVLVIDKRSHLKPYDIVQKVPGRTHSGMTQAPWYILDEVERKYSWLRGAADLRDGDKVMTGTPSSLSVLPQANGVTFVAQFIPKASYPSERAHKFWATAPVEPSDLLVALVYISADDQIYWAQRLYG